MKTYLVRTFGCQMNQHDSERIAGLLEERGLRRADAPGQADVIVFNTCCVRESADERLYGQVASLKSLKSGGRADLIVAVGGCIGQRDGAELLHRMPHVDVVFGTHNVAELPALLDAAEAGRRTAHVLEAGEGFASDLPTVPADPWRAWVSITVGCDNRCSYCIVPYVRGPERSRAFEDVLAEVNTLQKRGVVEVTLLGQNVNSYGRDRYGEPRFAELLRAVGGAGIPRVRFTTSHPKDLSDATIAAIAEVSSVMPYLHLPVQAGSDRILEAMNRSYTREQYLRLAERIRAAIPGIALSTDVIVGFPGETADDFEQTLDVFQRVRFDHAFTFIYSPREGTPAARLVDDTPRATVQERFDRLAALVRDLAYESNLREVGQRRTLLVQGPSKRDPAVLAGRTPANRLTHVPVPPGSDAHALAGTFLDVRITEAHPWFLAGEAVSDGAEGRPGSGSSTRSAR